MNRRQPSALSLVAALVLGAGVARAQSAEAPHDTFFFIGEINKASIVMLAETGLVPRPLAGRIAKGIRTAIDSQALPGAPRPADYSTSSRWSSPPPYRTPPACTADAAGRTSSPLGEADAR
jgi:hypothetical protein